MQQQFCHFYPKQNQIQSDIYWPKKQHNFPSIIHQTPQIFIQNPHQQIHQSQQLQEKLIVHQLKHGQNLQDLNQQPQDQYQKQQTYSKESPCKYIQGKGMLETSPFLTQSQNKQQKQSQVKQTLKKHKQEEDNQNLINKTPDVKQNQLEELILQDEYGYIYKGQGFKPDTKEGQGILTDNNSNTIYDGQWKNNQYHGHGKLNNLKPQEIEGPFNYLDLSAIGNGWLEYDGNFSEGKIIGVGSLKLSNEEVIQGTFSDGIIDGKGKFYTINGQFIKGLWRKGIFVKVFS